MVHFHYSLAAFGMSMNDGQKVICGREAWAEHTAELPEKITRIDMTFRKGEHMLHSIKFIIQIDTGEETKEEAVILQVGGSYHEEKEQEKPGRVATVSLGPNEELFGCELHHGSNDAQIPAGLTWFIKCISPKKEPED